MIQQKFSLPPSLPSPSFSSLPPYSIWQHEQNIILSVAANIGGSSRFINMVAEANCGE